jgi:hypothetical protein
MEFTLDGVLLVDDVDATRWRRLDRALTDVTNG